MAITRKVIAIALVPVVGFAAIVTAAFVAPAFFIKLALPADTPVHIEKVEGFRPSVVALLRGELVADVAQVILVPARKGLWADALVLDKVSVRYILGSGDTKVAFHLGPHPATLNATGPGLVAADVHIGESAQRLDLSMVFTGSTVTIDLEGENTSDIFARVINTDSFSPYMLPQRFNGHLSSSVLGLQGKLSAAGEGFALESTAESTGGVTTLDVALGLVQKTESETAPIDLKAVLDDALRQVVTVAESWRPQDHTALVTRVASLVRSEKADIRARLFRLAPGESLVAQSPEAALAVKVSIARGVGEITAILPANWTVNTSPIDFSGALTPSAEGLALTGMFHNSGTDGQIEVQMSADPTQALHLSMDVFTKSHFEAQVSLDPGGAQKIRLTGKGSFPTTVLGAMDSILRKVLVDLPVEAKITAEMTAALGENGAVNGQFSTKLAATTLSGRVDWDSTALKVQATASMPRFDATGLSNVEGTTTLPDFFRANGSLPPWLVGDLKIDAGILQFGEVSLRTVTGNVDTIQSTATLAFRSVSYRGENWLDHGSLSMPLGEITIQTPLVLDITLPIGNSRLSYAPQSRAGFTTLNTLPGIGTFTAPGIDANVSLTPVVGAAPVITLHGTVDVSMHKALLNRMAGSVSGLLAEKFEFDVAAVLGDRPQLQRALLTSPSLSMSVQPAGDLGFKIETQFPNSKPILQYLADVIPASTGTALDSMPASLTVILAVENGVRIQMINGTWGDANLRSESNGDQVDVRFLVPAHSRLFALASSISFLDRDRLASNDLNGQLNFRQSREGPVLTAATLQTGTVKGNVGFDGAPTAANSAGDFRLEAATLGDARALFNSSVASGNDSSPFFLAGRFSYAEKSRSFVELKSGVVNGMNLSGVAAVDGIGNRNVSFANKFSSSDGQLQIHVPPAVNGFDTEFVVNAVWKPGPAGTVGSVRLLKMPLFNGNLGGEVIFSVDANAGTLALTEVKADVSQVDLQTVCKVTPWKIFGAGKFNASLNGRSTKSVPLSEAFDPGWIPKMIANIGGTGQIDISDGHILDINLDQDIPNAGTITVGTGSATFFRRLHSSFRVDDNVLYFKDGKILTDALDLTSEGSMRLSDNFIDVRIVGSIIAIRNSASDKDMVKLGIIPLRIQGTPDNVGLQFLPNQGIGQVTTRVLLRTVETLNAADATLAKVQNSVDQKVTELLFRPLFGRKVAETAASDRPPSSDPCL